MLNRIAFCTIALFQILMVPIFLGGGDWELDAFDGTLNTIMGPFDTPIPRDFFYQPQIHIKSNGLNYHTTFDLEIAALAETKLIIENPMKDSSPIPVTVSVIFPKGEWRNFIITLPESNTIKINMNSRIKEILNEKYYNVSNVDLLTFVVISGSPINVKLGDSSLMREYTFIPIVPPDEIPGGGGGTSDPPGGGGTAGCHPCTSQGGGMPIHVINNQNGGVTQAYLNMSYRWEESQNVRDYYTGVQVDYPSSGQAFHYATNELTSSSWVEPNGVCINSEWGAHTTQSYNANCAFNLQRHSWYDMKKLTNFCGTATAVATSGCNAGWSWTITF